MVRGDHQVGVKGREYRVKEEGREKKIERRKGKRIFYLPSLSNSPPPSLLTVTIQVTHLNSRSGEE